MRPHFALFLTLLPGLLAIQLEAEPNEQKPYQTPVVAPQILAKATIAGGVQWLPVTLKEMGEEGSNPQFSPCNPGIVLHKGALFAYVRLVTYQQSHGKWTRSGNPNFSKLSVVQVKPDNFQVLSSHGIRVDWKGSFFMGTSFRGLEDPRAFVWKGQVWLSTATSEVRPDHLQRIVLANVQDGNADKIDSVVVMKGSPDSQKAQKNWLPYVVNDDLFFIHSYSPLTIVHYAGSSHPTLPASSPSAPTNSASSPSVPTNSPSSPSVPTKSQSSPSAPTNSPSSVPVQTKTPSSPSAQANSLSPAAGPSAQTPAPSKPPTEELQPVEIKRGKPESDDLQRSLATWRGSCGPVHLHDNVWLLVIHTQRDEENGRTYQHRFVEVDIVSLQILRASDPMFFLQHRGVEMCTGLQLDDNKTVYIGLGVEDENGYIGKCPLQSILGMLKPLAQVQHSSQSVKRFDQFF